ncbi:MAG: DUF1810 domain-containing protein [Proteobacteria bacterium]|nr:DUF1810 domain-containing protein [Pseudomonadota bacterium]
MDAPYHLQRFVDAQQDSYQRACAELRVGEKRSHWMWYIFPQIAGLGTSEMAQRYAIASLTEARAYLQHPLLGLRLRECSRLVAAVRDRTIHDIFGYPDDMKFHSCMTLFAQAAPHDDLFRACLEKYFGGRLDAATLARLA